MSEAMRNLRNRLTGASNVEATTNGVSTPSPMLLGIMKSFGVSPEIITQYADSVKNAVIDRLTSIDDRLARIDAKLDTLEMKFAELESNQRVIMDSMRDANEQQFVQMAEQPLLSPIA